MKLQDECVSAFAPLLGPVLAVHVCNPCGVGSLCVPTLVFLELILFAMHFVCAILVPDLLTFQRRANPC
jgi:hypothetical protein